VLPIWEGTTNVLSLDVWRAIERTDALAPWLADVRARAECVRLPALARAARSVRDAADDIDVYVARTTEPAAREAGARRLAFAIARTAAASRMVEHAEWTGHGAEATRVAVAMANRWIARGLTPGVGEV
jgi:putative acyl-CoA dehydrogenase